MPEPTVQVPGSLIESWERRFRNIADMPGTADEVRALLSQPTPTAEPTLPVRAVAAVLDEYDNGDGECEPEDRWRLFRDMRSLLASEQVASPTTEPPRIEDLAPGTTFTAVFRDTERRALFVKVGGKTAWPIIDIASGALATYAADAVDPYTIRDVTPPKETR